MYKNIAKKEKLLLKDLCDLFICDVSTEASIQTGKNGGIAGKDFRRKCLLYNTTDNCHLVLTSLAVTLLERISLSCKYKSLLTIQIVLTFLYFKISM